MNHKKLSHKANCLSRKWEKALKKNNQVKTRQYFKKQDQ